MLKGPAVQPVEHTNAISISSPMDYEAISILLALDELLQSGEYTMDFSDWNEYAESTFCVDTEEAETDHAVIGTSEAMTK